MKKKVYIVVSIVSVFLIIAGIMLSLKTINKNTQNTEIIGKAEEVQEENHKQALETEPQVPETWDLNKVYPVLSEDNIYVPVPIGWTISTSEDERYVNGNVTKKGTLSNLTFTSTGDYPWTENESNIWVSGNKQIPNSTSELVSNEIEVGANGGWVEIEWSVCSQSGYDVLYMNINDTANGTSEQLPKEITGTLYGTAEDSLIYTKCGKELAPGKYTISIKYTKYNNTTHTGLDSGYVKSGTYIDYDENGTDELAIHKTGGFVIYEGTESITDLWAASKERNQFVWVPVQDASRIYEKNATTGKIKAKLWNFTATGRTVESNGDTDTKNEAGILGNTMYESIKHFSKYNMNSYSKDILYKELETEYKNTIDSIEKYGGFYIGRYETGNISSNMPVVKRMNTDIHTQNWYNLYARMRNINNNKNIQTNMIWGSLWEETLEWIIGTGEKTRVEISIDSISWGNSNNSIFQYYDNNGELTKKRSYGTGNWNRLPTGSSERNMANNIYDLAGNVAEFTLESRGSVYRDCRGRHFNETSGSVSNAVYTPPTNSSYNYGCRTFLYIF